MKQSTWPKLRCPACRQGLELETQKSVGFEIIEGRLTCQCGRSYPIQSGTPNFIYPAKLLPSDEEFQGKYNKGAEQYDTGIEWLFKSFFEDENSIRSQMVELLQVQPGSCVLDVGCGTGSDALHIARRIKAEGELYVLDISSGMIEIAKRRLASLQTPVEYFLSNASYLPFADGVFDAVFHFGGLNTFGEIGRALAEMTRVVRTGGKVVVGDESVAPWLRKSLFGRILMKVNPLYKHKPPLDCLPANAKDVCLRWILGNAFYLIEYRVSDGPPKLDLDLPIPGKGDTLRSRYYGPKTSK